MPAIRWGRPSAGSFTIALPDLAVTATSAPSSTAEGASLPVSWKVANVSATNPTGANWNDTVYISSTIPSLDAPPSADQRAAGSPLAPGASLHPRRVGDHSRQPRHRATTTRCSWPTRTTASPKADAGNDTNDVVADPITLTAADLQVSSVSGPAMGSSARRCLPELDRQERRQRPGHRALGGQRLHRDRRPGRNPELAGQLPVHRYPRVGASATRTQQVRFAGRPARNWFVSPPTRPHRARGHKLQQRHDRRRQLDHHRGRASAGPRRQHHAAAQRRVLRQHGAGVVRRQEPGPGAHVGAGLAGLGHPVAGSDAWPDLPGPAQRHRRRAATRPSTTSRWSSGVQQPQLPRRGRKLPADSERARCRSTPRAPGTSTSCPTAPARITRSPCRRSAGPTSWPLSAGFSVTLSPPPDLAVTGVQAPAQNFSGQPMQLSWTVANNGTGPTVASTWTDAVYMSPHAHPGLERNPARHVSLIRGLGQPAAATPQSRPSTCRWVSAGRSTSWSRRT